MGLLEGKVAIITGGGQGIGEGLVYAFCHEGAKVANLGRTYSKVERVVNNVKAEGLEAIAIGCDVSDPAQVEEAVRKVVETYGRIDVVVNNAATEHFAPFEKTDTAHMEEAFRNNVLGSFNCIKAAYPYLKESKGRVINFGSGAGISGSGNMCSYACSKEAVRGMTKALAVEFARYGINVNCIIPTGNSPAWEKTKEKYPDKLDRMLEGYLIRRPNHGLGDPEADIGGVAVFLASRYSQYMTGRTLFADGGKSLYR